MNRPVYAKKPILKLTKRYIKIIEKNFEALNDDYKHKYEEVKKYFKNPIHAKQFILLLSDGK